LFRVRKRWQKGICWRRFGSRYQLGEENSLRVRTYLVKVGIELHDLVGNSTSLGEGRDILSNTAEGNVQSLGHSSRKLSFWLFSDNRQCTGSLGLGLFDVSSDGRVDTTAKTTVRGDGEVEDLGVLGLVLGGLGLCEEDY